VETKSITLGQQIKRYRLINDIRQEDMAEKMEVSRATLINYEKGHTVINVDVLNRLKKHYPDFDLDTKDSLKPKIIVENTIDFRVLFNVLSNKKKYIFFITILFSILGTSCSFLLTKQYSAEITLYPAKKDISQGLGQFQSLAANFGMNTSNNDQNFNISDVVKSRLIANKMVNHEWKAINGHSMDLIGLWGLNKDPWYSFKSNNNIDSLIIIEKAIQKFNKHVKVSEDRLSGLIKITTSLQDPLISASVANFFWK
jgi:Uncharacterized protein involved in exopolysaccharide biosynthesis